MSTIEIQTKAAGAGKVSEGVDTNGNYFLLADGTKLYNLFNGIVQPLTGVISTNTTFTLPNTNPGIQTVKIPETYLVGNSASSLLLTITTGIASTNTVVVPVAKSADTIDSGPLLFDVEVDSVGNLTSKAWNIKGSNSNGTYLKKHNGDISERITYTFAIAASTSQAVNVPVPSTLVSNSDAIVTCIIGPSANNTGVNMRALNSSLNGANVVFYVENGPTAQNFSLRIYLEGRWRT